MIGIDISEAQLIRAHNEVRHAAFVCADMTKIAFRPNSFDVVTNFWAGYCYLRSKLRISTLVRSAADWIAEGGTFYMEVLIGDDLAAFNRSRFSGHTGFRVTPLTADFSEWQYEDVGGQHVMTSPPLVDFLDILSPLFNSVESAHDGAFMVHVIARGRR